MDVSIFTDKINLVIGAIIALMSYLFGEHWILFGAFLVFNLFDFLTRWITSRINGDESSKRCFVGILKKLGYWIMIALGFGMSVIFIEIGEVIGVDLQITALLGWFVLATLMINEIRSILENLVEGGFHVPLILTKGLEITNKMVESAMEFIEEEDEDQNEIK